MPHDNGRLGCMTCKKLKYRCSLQKSARTQEDDKLAMVIVEASAIPVDTILWDDMAEECEEPGEETVEDPQDTFSKVIEGNNTQPAEHETEHEEMFSVVNNEVPGLEMVVHEPLAPGPQEEDDLADAHKAKVAAFAAVVDQGISLEWKARFVRCGRRGE